MGAKNQVIAGDHGGQRIRLSQGRMYIGNIDINKETVDRFEIMDESINTTSFTSGKTKKSMLGAGTKGAVGAVVGSAFGPVGTIIGAGAGVATSKAKNKSVTKEITTKEIMLAVYFKNGEQSLLQLDDKFYKLFLKLIFSGPVQIKRTDPKTRNKVLKGFGWLFVPYIMIFVFWKNLAKPNKIIGATWAVLSLLIGFFNK